VEEKLGSGPRHVTFIVGDLDRMEEILTTVFAARKVCDSGTETFSLSKERFFLIGDGEEPVWIATMKGEPLPTRTYNHVAFKIADSVRGLSAAHSRARA
jgi:catechol 2,3-dioxygenase-like lactoylglutathione lyase family enzyme